MSAEAKQKGGSRPHPSPGPLRFIVQLPDGSTAPLVATPRQWRELVNDPRTEGAIRSDCEAGIIPTLPRPPGGHHRIAVAKALEALGVRCEIVGVATEAVTSSPQDGDEER